MMLTNNMQYNLINIKRNQIFTDCKYKIILQGLKNYNFFVIIGFDNINNKLILYLFVLIRHEKKENFEDIFNYLNKYEFLPNYINCD